MTMSIVARGSNCGSIGIVCATGSLAVGGFVPHIRLEAGAVITQGFSTSIPAAEFALEQLTKKRKVEQIVLTLQECDSGSDWRQIGVMDMEGNCAGWTGERNIGYYGMHSEKGLLIAGNMLCNDLVIPAMHERMHARGNQETLSETLLAALEEGLARGGDRRGCLSAALLVCGIDHPPLSLRIDDSESPVAALAKLYRRWRQSKDFQGFLARLPTSSDPCRY